MNVASVGVVLACVVEKYGDDTPLGKRLVVSEKEITDMDASRDLLEFHDALTHRYMLVLSYPVIDNPVIDIDVDVEGPTS